MLKFKETISENEELTKTINELQIEIADTIEELMDNVTNGNFTTILIEVERLQLQLKILTKEL